jgi:hypothetical protein
MFDNTHAAKERVLDGARWVKGACGCMQELLSVPILHAWVCAENTTTATKGNVRP